MTHVQDQCLWLAECLFHRILSTFSVLVWWGRLKQVSQASFISPLLPNSMVLIISENMVLIVDTPDQLVGDLWRPGPQENSNLRQSSWCWGVFTITHALAGLASLRLQFEIIPTLEIVSRESAVRFQSILVHTSNAKAVKAVTLSIGSRYSYERRYSSSATVCSERRNRTIPLRLTSLVLSVLYLRGISNLIHTI